MLHGHGDDGYRFGKRVRADFSSNCVRDERVLAALEPVLSSAIVSLSNYPEPEAESLRDQIAEMEGVAPENVIVTAGAVAGVYLIAQALVGVRSTIFVPTFSEYEDACRSHGHVVRVAPFNQVLSRELADADAAWLCCPNNPTGDAIVPERLLEWADRTTSCVHIVDTAYESFCDTPAVSARCAVERENLLLVKSLTKRFGIPGLRLGYVVGSTGWIRRLRAKLQPWTVGALEIAAGRFLIRERDRFPSRWPELKAEAQALQRALALNPAFRVTESSTHFFLVRLSQPRSSDLKQWLMDRHGLLIRDAANFRGLDAHFVRIAARLDEANTALVDALNEWSQLVAEPSPVEVVS